LKLNESTGRLGISVLLTVFLLTLSQSDIQALWGASGQICKIFKINLVVFFFFCEECLRDSQEMTMLLGFHISMMAGKYTADNRSYSNSTKTCQEYPVKVQVLFLL